MTRRAVAGGRLAARIAAVVATFGIAGAAPPPWATPAAASGASPATATAPVPAAGAGETIRGPASVLPLSRRVLDGRDDDLLSAGLGLEGLQSATPPAFADPARPTPVELRRRAYWSNWRGLIDLSAGGGAGRLFGPRGGERVAGLERLGALRLAGARDPDAVLLQVPSGFDPRDPCLVAVAASGSRGVFGAVPTAGEWGLRQGCAVVTTDKGTGNGFYDPVRRAAIRLDGTSTTDLADASVGFVPRPPLQDGSPWLLSKHAHSGVDPEPRWGERLIEATRVAFDWLNEEYAAGLSRPLAPANTRVIAAGISNGGAVVLRALELDRGTPGERWFDGAVVAEPNAIVAAALPRLVLGDGASRREYAVRGLLDYATLHGLLQPCALLAPAERAAAAMMSAAARAAGEAWCADLAAHGEVRGADATTRAADARAQLLAAGVEPGALALGPLNVGSQLWLSIATTYLHAHAGARPHERPCGLAFAAVDAAGRPRTLPDEEWTRLFSDASGIPPTAGIGLVRADGQPAAAPATLRCLRSWVDAATGGAGETAAAQDVDADFGRRLRAGLAAIQMRADPGRRPVIVLHGRLDGLIPVNHSSRPWYVAALRRAPRAELRYYEIAHAQHFDAFVALPGFDSAFVPMQPYLLAAMDLMAARLRAGAALPSSQVLRSRPRATAPGGAVPLDAANLGTIQPRPSAADRVTVQAGALVVPD